MDRKLKVLISGTGFAGQGHADAFRAAGADVVGIVGRTPEVVEEVARKLEIPYSGTNWKQALQDCQPDIVSIATPGGAHYATIKQAIAERSHVFCDKPLTAEGETAIELYELAIQANVKTAFAASFRYMPDVIHAKRLVANGAIGEPVEVECISHFNLEREIPFGWSHRKEDGGGRLNNNFTHKLSIVTSVIGEKILSIIGDVRDDLGRAPIVKGVHNFKREEIISLRISTIHPWNGVKAMWNGRIPSWHSWRVHWQANRSLYYSNTVDSTPGLMKTISYSMVQRVLFISKAIMVRVHYMFLMRIRPGKKCQCLRTLTTTNQKLQGIRSATGITSFVSL